MTSATFSAPGKLMLFGEYAVLEGHPALALCFDRRIRCRATPGGGVLRFDAPELFAEPVEVAVDALAGDAPRPELGLLWPLISEAARALDGLSLRFDAGFPPTWGLGSSSASVLAAVAAVRSVEGRLPPSLGLFTTAHGLQRLRQGAASGYDIATQLVGGIVHFQDLRGHGGGLQLRRVAPPVLHWVVAWTGAKASTASMIEAVRERHPPGSPIYSSIGALVDDAAMLIEERHVEALGEALNRGHELLAELGAVPDELDGVIRRLGVADGVHGARMSGAGGGDCVLVLAEDPDKARRAVEEAGFQILPLKPTHEGLREEPDEEAP